MDLRKALMLDRGGVISLVGAGGKTTLMYRLARELALAGDSVLTTTTTKILRPTAEQSPGVILARSSAQVVERAGSLLVEHRHLTAAAGERAGGKLTGFIPEIIDALHRSGLFCWIIVEADGAARMPLKAPADHEPVVPASTRWLIGLVGLDAVGKPMAAPWVFRAKRFAKITGIGPGQSVSTASVAALIRDAKGLMKGAPEGAVRLAFANKADDATRIAAGRKIAGLLAGSDAGADIARLVVGRAAEAQPVVACYDLQAAADASSDPER